MLFLIVPFTLALSQITFVLADSSGSYYGNYPCIPNPNDAFDTDPCSASGPPGSLCVATIPAFYGGYYCGTQGAACVIDGNCDGGYCYNGQCAGGLNQGCDTIHACLGELDCPLIETCGGPGAACLENWHCGSASCSNNRCTNFPYGRIPCNDNHSADGGNQNLCTTSDLPGSACRGSIASQSYSCGISGSTCLTNADCDQGLCNVTTGVCRGGAGDSCSSATDCLGHLECGSGPNMQPTCGGLGASCALHDEVPIDSFCNLEYYYCGIDLKCSQNTYGNYPCTGLDGNADQGICEAGLHSAPMQCTLEEIDAGCVYVNRCTDHTHCDAFGLEACKNGFCTGGLGDSCVYLSDCLGGLDCGNGIGSKTATCGGVTAFCSSFSGSSLRTNTAPTLPLQYLCMPDDKCVESDGNSRCILREEGIAQALDNGNASNGSTKASIAPSATIYPPTDTPTLPSSATTTLSSSSPSSGDSQPSAPNTESGNTASGSMIDDSTGSDAETDASSSGDGGTDGSTEGDISNTDNSSVDYSGTSDDSLSTGTEEATDSAASDAESSVTADYTKTATPVIDALQQIGVTVTADQVNAVIAALQAGDGTITEDGIIAVLRALQLGNGTVTQAVVDAVIQALQSTGGVVTQAEVEALIVGSAGNSTAAGQAIMSLLKSGVLGSLAGLPLGIGALSLTTIIVSNITTQSTTSVSPTSSTTQSISPSTTSSSDPTHTITATTTPPITTHSAGMFLSARLDVVTGLLVSWIIVFI